MTKHRVLRFIRPKGFELPKPAAKSSHPRNPCKYRESLQPGTVVIIAAGPYTGKRAVLLRTLEAGLVVVSGISSLTGVPMMRVNQRYLITTSTKVDGIAGKDFSKFSNLYFKKDRDTSKKITDTGAPVPRTAESEYKADQSNVDKIIADAVGDCPAMKSYLNGTFSLDQVFGVKAHQLVF